MRALAQQLRGSLTISQASFFILFFFGLTNLWSQNIQELEYFYNGDPGFGNGTTITAATNTGELTQSLSLPVTGLGSGFHKLTIRALDDINTYSLYDSATFYIPSAIDGSDPITNLAAAEYWFNADPGQGNGTALSISGNPSEVTESFVIPLGSLDLGFHTLGLRIQNTDGTWSLFDQRTFFISETIGGSDPIVNIAGAEYWFNEDPGQGNGTTLSISGSPSEAAESYVIPLGNLAAGFHKIGLRAQNLDGTWGLHESRVFYVFEALVNQPISPLAEAEFLYDAELGFGTGTSAALAPTGNPDEYIIEIPTDMVTCDLHDIWVSIKNEDGNYSLYKVLLDVDVFDDQNPTIVVFPDITVELDANGEGSITLDDVNNGTFDDCQLVTVVLNQAQFNYTCADLGANTVTITATDAESKVSTQDVTITVVDNSDPIAVAQNFTVQLDANGLATVAGDDLENGSTDNCSIVSRSVDISSFSCDDLGANTVNFTVTDPDGNTNAVSAVVTIVDTTDPAVITQNITVQLDAAGVASITPDSIDLSSDNCTIVTKSLDIDSFDCTHLGVNTVTVTVTDQSGNSDTATAIVTVEDAIAPNVVTQNLTVQLNASGEASVTADAIDNGSTDNCSIASRSLDVSAFDCSNIGDNVVTLSVIDTDNVTGTATAIVTVVDGINPVALAQSITIQLEASGNTTISADDVDNNSTDNCSIDMKSLDISSFSCDDIGANTVILTVTDASGNQNTTTATVTVEDTVAPSVVTQNSTVQLDANGLASITIDAIDNGSTDNCGIASRSLDISSFDCSNLGANTITLSVTDESNVVGTNTAIVTVEDPIDPSVIGQDITVDLGGNPSVTITAEDIDNGSSDNCGTTILSIDVDTFTATGDYPVVLTVEDVTGNADTVTVTVTVTNVTLGLADEDIDANAIRLYPNPTSEILFFETKLMISQVNVYDINGKIVLRKTNPNNQLHVTNWSEGIYFIQFNLETGMITKRFMKQ